MLAFAGLALPAVEAGIAASLLVLGLLIATAVRLPVAVGALIAAVFAVFHGHAHGAEIPQAHGTVAVRRRVCAGHRRAARRRYRRRPAVAGAAAVAGARDRAGAQRRRGVDAVWLIGST
ncbi:MAG: HupE/UreJ family protein [Chromatiales bacterium]|nr:HupE/UreJ family protein [Chromatiales bacterium]